MSDEKSTTSTIFKVLAEKTKGTAVGTIFDTLTSPEGRKAIEGLAGRAFDTVKTAVKDIKDDAEEALLTARLETLRNKKKTDAQTPAATPAPAAEQVQAPKLPDQRP